MRRGRQLVDISVVAAAREDDTPPLEALAIAANADRLGYPEVWAGEGQARRRGAARRTPAAPAGRLDPGGRGPDAGRPGGDGA
jgi:hypothetical protein